MSEERDSPEQRADHRDDEQDHLETVLEETPTVVEKAPQPPLEKNNPGLKAKFRELEFYQQLTFVLSFVAILLTLGNAIYTASRDISQDSRQRELSATQEALQNIQATQVAARATFEVDAQRRSETISAEQNNLQATQVALAAEQTAHQADLIALHRQLAYPYVQLARQPEPSWITVIASDDSGVYELSSSTTFLLVNNGGGQTSLIGVDFLPQNEEQTGLVWQAQIADPLKQLPFNMAGQSGFDFDIALYGLLVDSDLVDQPGIIVIEKLTQIITDSTQHLRFEFSNTEALDMPIEIALDPSLSIVETGYAAAIPVTTLDNPSVICFEVTGLIENMEAVFIYHGRNGFQESDLTFPFSQSALSTGCWSLPAGYYSFSYRHSQSPSPAWEEFIARPEQIAPISIIAAAARPTPTPTPTTPPDFRPSLPSISLEVVALTLGAAFMTFFMYYAASWVALRTISPPPHGLLGVVHLGHPEYRTATFSLRDVGLNKRTRKIIVGGNKKRSHIYVEGLQPEEFVIKRAGKNTIVGRGGRIVAEIKERDIDQRVLKATRIKTSIPDVVLLLANDMNELETELRREYGW